MNFIKEHYNTNYAPQLDENNYCYYINKTNYDIMIKLISNYQKDVLDYNSRLIDDKIHLLKKRLERGPVLAFFEDKRVSYDNTYDYCSIDFTYAATNKYTIIKLEQLKVLSIK